MESKKRDRSIAGWIGRPFKPPLRNEDEEDENEEEYSVAPLSSTKDGSPRDKANEGRKEYQKDNSIYDRKDTVLYDVKDNKEEASLGHEGKSSSSELSKNSDDKDLPSCPNEASSLLSLTS